MRLEDIGFYTLSDERARTATSRTIVKRLEVLITDRCNFKCPYCRGVKPDLRGELSIDSFVEILDNLSGRVENIRFSGGEPTLNYDLAKMVCRAKGAGVKRIAVSTNGSAPREIYEDLMREGVNDFSVSLDACCSTEFQKMSGGVDRWDVVVENIRWLSSKTYTTIGVVLNVNNEGKVYGIVEYARSLGVSDIRVIPSAQHGSFLSSLPVGESAHPILMYRANNARNNVQVRGLSEKDSVRCPLVLDDLAVAGGKHFPCIIYLREGGEPIGLINPNIREERRQWFEDTDTHRDKICQSNCLDVCRDHNNRWNEYRTTNV